MKIYSKILKTKELENKINSLVYKLYKFSDDEISIIKGE